MSTRVLTTLAAMGVVVLAACEGENLFSVPGGTQGARAGTDADAPVVSINSPRGDSLSAKPLGDSVFVSAHVTDDVGVTSVSFFGVALRGDEDLGTDTVILRFEEKTISLPAGVEDTTLTRYIIPTADSVKETALIIVAATDSTGNIASDTVNLVLGGPDVELLDLEDGQSIQAGLNLSARVRAQDPQGLSQVRLVVSGAFDATVVKSLNPPADSITLDTLIAIPNGVTGPISLIAIARNSLDVAGQDGPVTLNVIAAGVGDTIAPRLKHVAEAPPRMELQDTVLLEITGTDDTQGTGVQSMGYTVLGISPGRGDTLVRGDSRVFDPARTGSVTSTFSFPSFNVDSLNLPDTLIFEVTSWMVDAEGNCSASVGLDSLVALPCGMLDSGETVADNRTGERLTRSIVAGRTVMLPQGGRIMDAQVDTARKVLLLSNLDRDRVEVFRLPEERFQAPIPVGSEPWGLALNSCAPLSPAPGCGDTLLVANSGGTNISNVYLGFTETLEGSGEDTNRRFLTPDVVLFDIESKLDEGGFLRYNVFPLPNPGFISFSDRPQFMARDSTGRILYSTKTVEVLNQHGTLRKAFVPPGTSQPEVKMFIEHAALINAPDFTAIGHIDGVNVVVTGMDDNVILRDHTPGEQTDTLYSVQDVIGLAAADIAGQGSDIVTGTGRFSVPNIGFQDTTFVSASGDGGWVVFGEGGLEPVGRIIMYEAARDRISSVIEVWDDMTNAGESVRGIGLNYDGTLGVARGRDAYFFTTDLRLQGIGNIDVGGGAGAALHPLHADQQTNRNIDGGYRPNTHIAFVGTGERTVDIYDTFHFFRSGRIFIRDIVNGPLRASLPFPEDNLDPEGNPFQCRLVPVTDQEGRQIGNTTEIFQNDEFDQPWPADGGVGGSEDRCVVMKLYGTTDAGGVVVINVRKSDVLRDHPARQGNP